MEDHGPRIWPEAALDSNCCPYPCVRKRWVPNVLARRSGQTAYPRSHDIAQYAVALTLCHMKCGNTLACRYHFAQTIRGNTLVCGNCFCPDNQLGGLRSERASVCDVSFAQRHSVPLATRDATHR
jgi:hypothetical protein